jgi:hypothetical protein
MTVLIIGEVEKAAIKAAMKRARSRPIQIEAVAANAIPDQASDVVTLEDRLKAPRGDFTRPISEQVNLPVEHRLAISYEEQPVGLCLHISMSIDKPNRVPHPAAMATVAQACGIDIEALPPGRTWVEEFTIDGQPGGRAVNMLFLV